MTNPGIEVIAANLLLDRTCDNCRYHGWAADLRKEYVGKGDFCSNPRHKRYSGYREELPIDNTCDRWKEKIILRWR